MSAHEAKSTDADDDEEVSNDESAVEGRVLLSLSSPSLRTGSGNVLYVGDQPRTGDLLPDGILLISGGDV